MRALFAAYSLSDLISLYTAAVSDGTTTTPSPVTNTTGRFLQ